MLALTDGSPPLPLFLVLPVLLGYAVLVVFLCVRVSASTSFLVSAFALRLAMSSQPEFSFAASPAGLSWNALVSVGLVAIGSQVLLRSRAVPLVLVPLVPLAILVAISAALNGEAAGGVETLVKYAYFAMIALAAYDAFRADGYAAVLSRLLSTFSLPLTMQCASLVLGISKANESDGSASYIGGYNHEASFSIILLTALLTAMLHPGLKGRYKILVGAITISGIAAANYRTAILAAAPLLIGLLISAAAAAVPPRQRGVAGILIVLAMLAAVPVIPVIAGERFEAIATLAANPEIVNKSPDDFQEADREMMSGRLFLWSQYIDAWQQGGSRQHLIGFGANAWEGRYRYYAHNTLVSTLYELGALGVMAMLLLWSWMLALALSAARGHRLTLVTAHLGFFVLNMATMPIWMIEGLLFYGLLCGFTIHAWLDRSRVAPGPSRNEGRPVSVFH